MSDRSLKCLAFFGMMSFASCAPPDAEEFGTETAALAHDPKLDGFQAKNPIRIRGNGKPGGGVTNPTPTGLSPSAVRNAYGLPSTGGFGTIAIIDAYDDPKAESDLNVFSAQYGLPACTASNGCFEKHAMAARPRADAGWALEISLDVQWAHAIAPSAKILLVEAKSASGTDLLAAVDYARNRADVVAVSMSWGGGEFSSEASYDSYFTSVYGATFFASSGDSGTGASWPASSPNVVAVGGTTLAFNLDGSLASETAWDGSGGGLSAYQPAPAYQTAFGLTGNRAIPDVSANADPASGYSVYDSYGYAGQSGWFQVGGTSGSCPLWAAIKSLGLSADDGKFYQDAAGPDSGLYFRDITSGTNGSCGVLCTAGTGYDEVTGLGSPLATVY
ncbi:MAG TPA: S53 family peptidase [Candidatus Baltobacteraceae bacterium]|nr:S53 family peptidase [Candidatus Baltobacteraceae bacterium]